MKLAKLVLALFALLVVGFVGIGFLLPSQYSVERSIIVDAPIDVVFDHVNDLPKNESWSPWKAADPTMKWTMGDKTTGLGASYSWTSDNSGIGDLTISKSELNKHIQTELNFGPQGQGQGFWDFEQLSSGVKVTWSMTGDAGNNPVGRYFGLMIDNMVGPQFELGLANLKQVTEQVAAEMPADAGSAAAEATAPTSVTAAAPASATEPMTSPAEATAAQ